MSKIELEIEKLFTSMAFKRHDLALKPDVVDLGGAIETTIGLLEQARQEEREKWEQRYNELHKSKMPALIGANNKKWEQKIRDKIAEYDGAEFWAMTIQELESLLAQ